MTAAVEMDGAGTKVSAPFAFGASDAAPALVLFAGFLASFAFAAAPILVLLVVLILVIVLLVIEDEKRGPA